MNLTLVRVVWVLIVCHILIDFSIIAIFLENNGTLSYLITLSEYLRVKKSSFYLVLGLPK